MFNYFFTTIFECKMLRFIIKQWYFKFPSFVFRVKIISIFIQIFPYPSYIRFSVIITIYHFDIHTNLTAVFYSFPKNNTVLFILFMFKSQLFRFFQCYIEYHKWIFKIIIFSFYVSERIITSFQCIFQSFISFFIEFIISFYTHWIFPSYNSECFYRRYKTTHSSHKP